MTLRVLDLFSGIGGFSLGLERTGGFETVAFCEIDPYCRAVLRKHWPDVPCFEDIRTFAGVECDVICGGFPCQDISVAGRGEGIEGERSGLWVEYARLVGELRPRYVIVENVAALTFRGLLRVLGDLAALGYDAEWHCIPASYVGARHRRDRVWIIAYPNRNGCDADHKGQGRSERPSFGSVIASCKQRSPGKFRSDCGAGQASASRIDEQSGTDVAHPASVRLEEQRGMGNSGDSAARGGGGANHAFNGGWWKTEPDVGRVADGVPSRVDRLKTLGNAVVPQVVQLLGEAILEAERICIA